MKVKSEGQNNYPTCSSRVSFRKFSIENLRVARTARHVPIVATQSWLCFLVSGFLHDVRNEFTDDVSKLTVGPIFTGHMTSLLVTSNVI